MIDAKEFQQKMIQLRQEDGFQTNTFLLPNQLIELLTRKDTLYEVGKHHIAVLERQPRFFRLHFYVSQVKSSAVALQEFVYKHSNCAIVADIVNRPQVITKQAAFLEQIGFRHIETLTRMQLKPGLMTHVQSEINVERAILADAEEIEHLLYQTFDPFVSRLPDRKELLKLIEDGNVLAVRDRDGIAGLVQFKPMPGQRILLDQILVRSDSRGHKFGEALLQTGIAQLGMKKWVSLWAHETVINFYEKYGFEREERVDFIFLFEGENNYGKDL